MSGSIDVVDGPAGPVFDVEVAGPMSTLDLSPRGPRGPVGPQGPASPASVVTFTDPVATPGASTVAAQIRRSGLSRVHARDGLSGWSRVQINRSGATDDPVANPNVLSVNNGRLRVTGQSGSSLANRREAWVLDGTDGIADSEIRSIWWGPSALNASVATPQMGHVHRCTATGGIVVDQNIVGSVDSTWIASWGWDGVDTLTIGTAIASPGSTNPPITVLGVKRAPAGANFLTVVEVDSLDTLAIGDVVTVAGTGVAAIDGDRTITHLVPIASVIFGTDAPAFACQETGGSAVSRTLVLGHVTRKTPSGAAAPIGNIYPFHVASRVIGNVVTAKKWRVGTVEPPWSSASVLTNATSSVWSADLGSSSPAIPAAGKCGVLANHMRSSATIEYGDIEVREL